MAVTWLGTSSGTPTKDRNISCTLLRTPRAVYAVDCGEGSLAQLRRTQVDPGLIEVIFVTHMHGDHCFGLASMVAAATARRRQMREDAGLPVGAMRIFGPPGLSELLRAQMVLTGLQHDLRMPLVITEFVEEAEDAHDPIDLNDEGTVTLARQAPEPRAQRMPKELARRLEGSGLSYMARSVGKGARSWVLNHYKPRPELVWKVDCEHVTVSAAQLQHRVPCWGYVFDEKLPQDDDEDGWDTYRQLWQQRPNTMRQSAAESSASEAEGDGEDGEGDGEERRRPQQRGGGGGKPRAQAAGGRRPERRLERPPVASRRVVILGDTMDSSALAPSCLGADLIAHEATYSRGMEDKAYRAQHSTAWMAGQFARAVNAHALVMTHFSARYKALATTEAEGGEGVSYGGRRSHWQRVAAPDGSVETDQGTLQALINEAMEEFGGTAVCTAKDLFSVHVTLKAAPGHE